jgi:hypothetical protein
MFFILLGLFGIAAISLATIVAELRRAPEAYEDEHGFHILPKHGLLSRAGTGKTIKPLIGEKSRGMSAAHR